MNCDDYVKNAIAEKVADDINRLIQNAKHTASEKDDLVLVNIHIENTDNVDDSIGLSVINDKVSLDAGYYGTCSRIESVHMIYAMKGKIWFEDNGNWFVISYEKIIKSVSEKVMIDSCNFD